MPWISAGASLLGGLFSDDSASDAAAGQAEATNRATDLQKYIYDNNVKLNQGAITAGDLSRNKLLQLMGLGGSGTGAVTSGPTREQLRAQLLPQFTKKGTPAGYGPMSGNITYGPEGNNQNQMWNAATPDTIDEAGLAAAIDAQYQGQSQSIPGVDPNAPDYGSLMDTFDEPGDFTGADLQNDPGYQFGLNEGYKGLDRKAAAGGGYFSGAAWKAAQRFVQDYAGTKFNDAFERNRATTNDKYNRYTGNQTNTFNRLSSLAGGGQTAANQVQSAGANYANNTGDLLTNNANAQGAAGIAQGNAWNNAISGAAKQYTDWNSRNSLLNNMFTNNGTQGMSWGYDK